MSWYQPVTGLAPDTQYEYQLCGRESTWSAPACVGSNGGNTQKFFTAPSSTYGPLAQSWLKSFDGWPYAARAVVLNHVIYIGSWDGDERALDESGNVKWTTNLGQTTTTCGGAQATQGVTSAPAVDPSIGTLYLEDGTTHFDALDPNSGAILWSVTTDTTNGNYNWSSPLIYNGHAYVGTSSFCDDPLTQGKLLRINLSTHQVDGVFKVVPDGQLGGGIWTSPVVDPSTNTVFITAGTRVSSAQTYTEALVALDASTLAVKGSWGITDDCNPTCKDFDWGTSPILMTDSSGRQLIAAGNKDGYVYAFDRNNITAGPIWRDQIAVGGGNPQIGEGVLSNGVFDGKNLYFAGGNTTIGGKSYEGGVREIDPATGHYLWERGTGGVPLAALTLANGEVVAPTFENSGRAGLWVVNAATGNVDYANQGTFFAPPTVADGLLLEGDIAGNFFAFKFPSGPGAAVTSSSVSLGAHVEYAPPMPRTKLQHHIYVR